MRLPDTFAKDLADSGLFDAGWYAQTYEDVAALGMDPLAHFLRFGLAMGRDPGPLFDGAHYLAWHPGAAASGLPPLVHYLDRHRHSAPPVGVRDTVVKPAATVRDGLARLHSLCDRALDSVQAADLLGQVLGATLPGPATRLFNTFDTALEETVRTAAAALYVAQPVDHAQIKVSVVMPTYDRADRIGAAIVSVQAQSHENFELLVVDDASTDDTRSVLEGFAGDPRIRVFWNDHLGVSAARNTALQHATGRYVFYLDSDNVWTPDFLALMLAAFEVSDHACLYGAARLEDPQGTVLGYHGEPFDWAQCLEGNYIDMNVFAHRRDLIETCGVFDPDLQRMVDWDLILRFTRQHGAGYVPLIGCIYAQDRADSGRITTSKPYIFRKIVQEKHRRSLADTAQTLAVMSLAFALKIPVGADADPQDPTLRFAHGLKTAFERLGHSMRVDTTDAWDAHPPNATDCTIVLDGAQHYTPARTEYSLLWVRAQADHIPYEVYDAYPLVAVASASYAALLSHVLNRKIAVLPACIDSSACAYRDVQRRADGLLVRDGMNIGSNMHKWAKKAGLDLSVQDHGGDVAQACAAAAFTLIGQSQAARDFGAVSAAVLAAVGCGARVLSDAPASVAELCGAVVEQVAGPADLYPALSPPPVARTRRRAVADHLHAHHSFDARVGQIIGHIAQDLAGSAAQGIPSCPPVPARKRVGLIVDQTEAALRRLVAPLSTEHAGRFVQMLVLDGVSDTRLATCDICIVQGHTAVQDTQAETLLAALAHHDIPLYVDTQAAPALIRAARAVCMPSEAQLPQDGDAPGHVVPDTLDPRLWRSYDMAPRQTVQGQPLRALYTGGCGPAQDRLIAAFTQLAKTRPGAATLTVLAACGDLPQAPWLRVLTPPVQNGAQRARWLMQHAAQWDIGITDGHDSTGAPSDIAALEHAALGLVPLVPDTQACRGLVDAGCAVGCTGDDWHSTLLALIDTSDRLAGIRAAAQSYVWSARCAQNASETLVGLLMTPYGDM